MYKRRIEIATKRLIKMMDSELLTYESVKQFAIKHQVPMRAMKDVCMAHGIEIEKPNNDVERIAQLRQSGMSINDIASTLNRSKSYVVKHNKNKKQYKKGSVQ